MVTMQLAPQLHPEAGSGGTCSQCPGDRPECPPASELWRWGADQATARGLRLTRALAGSPAVRAEDGGTGTLDPHSLPLVPLLLEPRSSPETRNTQPTPWQVRHGYPVGRGCPVRPDVAGAGWPEGHLSAGRRYPHTAPAANPMNRRPVPGPP